MSIRRSKKLLDFNPRTHEGCDVHNILQASVSAISIHAPTRGATCHPRRSDSHEPYFNPRTHEGCDITVIKQITQARDFNPRTHEGCDGVSVFLLFAFCQFQSTHPRGVRPLCIYLIYLLLCNFNPRTHEGCDEIFHILFSGGNLFQSTHPRGVRPSVCAGS